MKSWSRYLVLCTAIMVATIIGAGASLAQSVPDLLKEGLTLLEAKDTKAALDKFNAAVKADPAHRGARMLLGVAENRTGNHAQALVSLSRAETMGVKVAQLYFEKGWAAVEMGLWDEAIVSLKRFEAAKPGVAKTAEYLGRAYIGKGQFIKATGLLNEAIQRDPASKPNALYYLAYMEKARGNIAAGDAYLKRLFTEVPESEIARSLKQAKAEIEEARLTGRDTAKNWTIDASAALGYTDNAFALPDTYAGLPTGVQSKESGLLMLSVNGRHDWRLSNKDVISAGYSFDGSLHVEDNESDSQSHVLYGNFAARAYPDVDIATRVGFGRTIVAGNRFRDQIFVRPSAAYRFYDRATLTGSYQFARNDYTTDASLAARERDGTSHTFKGGLALDFAGMATGDPRFTLGLSQINNDTDGADFDFKMYSLSLGVRLSLPWQVTLDAQASFGDRHFNHFNSLGFNGVMLSTVVRDDDVRTNLLRFSRPVNEKFDGFAQYRRIRNESNIGFYNYDQTTLLLGLQTQF